MEPVDYLFQERIVTTKNGTAAEVLRYNKNLQLQYLLFDELPSERILFIKNEQYYLFSLFFACQTACQKRNDTRT